MDEPFASLDEQTRLLLGAKVTAIQQELRQTTLLITHSLTEAVQLSDRIVVMTYRPGRVRRIVEVLLPRPRARRHPGQPGIRSLRRGIWTDLREEANARPRRRRTRGRRDAAALFGLATLIAAGFAVQGLIVADVISRYVVPPPSEVVAALAAESSSRNTSRRDFCSPVRKPSPPGC